MEGGCTGRGMMRSSLFCLLLLLASADDALARLTPDPEDDAAAAENNEYLAQPYPAPLRLTQQRTLPPDHSQPPAFSFGNHPQAPARAGGGVLPLGPELLHLLMSLQR